MSQINKISIIIVNFNSTDKCVELIKSLKFIEEIIGEIIVIDNNSKNFITSIFPKNPKLKFIENTENIGFSKAVNQGILQSKNLYILLLNPDTRLIDSSPIITFNKMLADNKIGIAGGRIINEYNGQESNTATNKPDFMTGLFEFTNLKKIFPNNKYSFNFWKKDEIAKNIPIYVFSICGAYVFLRKIQNNVQIKLNEAYFLYLEDLDLGYTVEKNGLRALFDPSSSVLHIGGYSSESKYKISLKYWYDSRKIFFSLHLSNIQGKFLYIIYSTEELLLRIYHYINKTPNA